MGGLFIPLLLGKLIALTFSEVLDAAAPLAPLKDALSLPGMVDELLRICAAPTALCCEFDFIVFDLLSSTLDSGLLFVVGAAACSKEISAKISC